MFTKIFFRTHSLLSRKLSFANLAAAPTKREDLSMNSTKEGKESKEEEDDLPPFSLTDFFRSHTLEDGANVEVASIEQLKKEIPSIRDVKKAILTGDWKNISIDVPQEDDEDDEES